MGKDFFLIGASAKNRPVRIVRFLNHVSGLLPFRNSVPGLVSDKDSSALCRICRFLCYGPGIGILHTIPVKRKRCFRIIFCESSSKLIHVSLRKLIYLRVGSPFTEENLPRRFSRTLNQFPGYITVPSPSSLLSTKTCLIRSSE